MHRIWLSTCTLLATAASAQTVPYPAQPVHLVVGFAAGGPSDIVARAFGDHAAKPLGQPIIIENKPGANAVLAAEAVSLSKPDGLTLLAAATNHTMIPALYAGRIKFDAAKSFIPVCTLASSATVLVVGPSLPVKNLAEFIGRAKAKPDSLTYATPGQGSSPHLATEQFQRLAGVHMVHVPYKGAAPAVTDLLGGQVDLSFATVGSVLPHLKSGKLKALAVAARQRSALLPDVPTFEEAGVKGYSIDTWYGLLAPAGTPAGAIQVLTREATEFSRSAALRERLAGAGLEPANVCGDAFAAQIAREIDSNTRIAHDLNLKAE
ncbi:tripartite tricarboxylate transporter substrate binding protein [Ideonella azotifigens]|uniref:Tripartite tricarboxylate transporter substrate binding protein n=1 Tax=Ideonella azotifigens TaxID=513160 RepID=A0ABN1KAA2_9BURK|nr:tripartite tricarboxylate transporter substrate binding protein [Ideonella azotifigens]MCD2338891.1 tripartite tricarboxylate transporter substrate binding protein [Ideonella azotifigens]